MAEESPAKTQPDRPHDLGNHKQCYHGGAFFQAIGPRFDRMHRINAVINADVLDAWFPPAPEVTQALQSHLPWLMRTSPPTHAEGLIHAIARARGIKPDSLLVGAGSSALIFLAFPHWLNPSSRVLLLDPTYGEYHHMLANVIGCRIETLTLQRADHYRPDLQKLADKLSQGFDMLIWVNPNSPTGAHVHTDDVRRILDHAPATTRVWIDETYIEYVDSRQSLEAVAATCENVVVCKSMSKVYALSGMRVAYLCAAPQQLNPLRLHTPPWAVGLPAQLAAVGALQAEPYYSRRYQQTHQLRQKLHANLQQLGLEQIIPGTANFLMCHLPKHGPTATTVLEQCRQHDLYLRDLTPLSPHLGRHAIRIAVKDQQTIDRMTNILAHVLQQATTER